MFTLRVPVLQTGAFTITLPAVNQCKTGYNNSFPFFRLFLSSVVMLCPRACTGRYLILFSEHVTGFEPVPPVWKTGMQPITPYVHWGEKCLFLLPFSVLKYCRISPAIDGTGVEPALPA